MTHEQGQDDRGREKAHSKPETSSIQAIDNKIPAVVPLDLPLNIGWVDRGFHERIYAINGYGKVNSLSSVPDGR